MTCRRWCIRCRMCKYTKKRLEKKLSVQLWFLYVWATSHRVYVFLLWFMLAHNTLASTQIFRLFLAMVFLLFASYYLRLVFQTDVNIYFLLARTSAIPVWIFIFCQVFFFFFLFSFFRLPLGVLFRVFFGLSFLSFWCLWLIWAL